MVLVAGSRSGKKTAGYKILSLIPGGDYNLVKEVVIESDLLE